MQFGSQPWQPSPRCLRCHRALWTSGGEMRKPTLKLLTEHFIGLLTWIPQPWGTTLLPSDPPDGGKCNDCNGVPARLPGLQPDPWEDTKARQPRGQLYQLQHKWGQGLGKNWQEQQKGIREGSALLDPGFGLHLPAGRLQWAFGRFLLRDFPPSFYCHSHR